MRGGRKDTERTRTVNSSLHARDLVSLQERLASTFSQEHKNKNAYLGIEKRCLSVQTPVCAAQRSASVKSFVISVQLQKVLITNDMTLARAYAVTLTS